MTDDEQNLLVETLQAIVGTMKEMSKNIDHLVARSKTQDARIQILEEECGIKPRIDA